MDKSCIDDLVEFTAMMNRDETIENTKISIRRKGIIPILKENELYIYKIKGNNSIDEICNYYRENMFDVYKKVVLNDNKFRQDFRKSDFLPFFKNFVSLHHACEKDIYEKFDLDDEKSKKDFIDKYAQEVELCIPIDKEFYEKRYRRERIDEIIQRIKPNYITCIFKRNSKIAEIINLVGNDNYFDLDFIATLICEYIYSKHIDFSTGLTIFTDEIEKINKMEFTDKELSFTEDEKIKFIRNIMDQFDMECLYFKDLAEISTKELQSILGTSSKEIIVDFAKHNSELLENSEFSDIYKKLLSQKSKVLEKK